jgi:hypothetical protein
MKKSPLALAALALLVAPAPAQKRELPAPPPRVIHWTHDDPRCDEVLSDGDRIRIIRDGDLAVAAVGYDAGGYTVVEVTVANSAERRVNVIPEDFLLTYQDEKGRYGYEYSLPPEKVAGKFKRRAKWGNFFRTLAAGMAQTTTTESGSVSIHGPGGVATGTYSGTTTRPDARSQTAARERSARATEEAEEKSARLIDSALKANTLFRNTYVFGFVYFERSKYSAASLNMIIDGTLYSFAFR